MRSFRASSPRQAVAWTPNALRTTGKVLLAGQLAIAASCGANLTSVAAQDRSSVVYGADGLRATAYTDCDASAYTLVSLTEPGNAERYAATEKFAAKIEPHAPQILNATAAWLDGDAASVCETPAKVETITLVGLVNALPVYAAVANRASGWRPGDTLPNARAVSTFARVMPATDAVDCAAFKDAAGSKVDKYRTRVFTIRAAHTTGQWSHMQALIKLVPVHQEIMGLVGQWAFEWQCDGVFALAGLAILADEERAVLLKWNKEKISERVAGASSPEERDAVMGEIYRSPSLPPVSSFDEIPFNGTIRYGGFLSPDVAAIEDMFAGADN